MTQKWSTPQLIQLSRGNPEEAVLEVCKVVRDGGGGPGNYNLGCANKYNPNCGTCAGIYAS